MALDNQRREQLIDELARRAAQLNLVAPAILFLEMNRPLAFAGAQVWWALEPILSGWFNFGQLHDVALLLEDPQGVEALITRLEAL